ncbi:MAG: hypothetical protein NC041_01515 [Bacteroides sp.]|nr:hypothetical protein [Prevotella sp.]MCM1407719.1 organic solvent tolerance protein OstA [Treponema brennaborense]MCM1469131.1 hypothetical protein [Bacteroides sp.]
MSVVRRFIFGITKAARIIFAGCFFLFFPPPNITAENIYFTANKMFGNTNENSRFTRLSGNAHIQTESIEIYADDILLDGDDFRYITASGNVRGTNIEAGFDFACQSMKYDRTEKIALLERSVTLDDTEHGVKADAQIIEYKQETETAVMQAGVSITQKKSVCTAAVAVYRKAEQMLELMGNPKVVQEDDTFIAQEITMNLETEEITLYGKVRGSVADSSGDSQSPASEKTETASAGDDGEAVISEAEQKPGETAETALPENGESDEPTEADELFRADSAGAEREQKMHDENGDKHE